MIQTFLNGFTKNGSVNRILVTGGTGAFGRDLTPVLHKIYGNKNVLTTDISDKHKVAKDSYKHLDVTDKASIAEVISSFKPDTIIHLASTRPDQAEENPNLALNVNAEGSRNILEAATENSLRILAASSVETFGTLDGRRNIPNVAVQRPETMLGITQMYLELIGNYHRKRYNTDFRAIRYPAIVSPTFLPGRANSDLIEIFYAARLGKKYKSYLSPNKLIPAIYVDEAIISLIKLLETPKESLQEIIFNVSSCSFTPKQLVNSIQKKGGEFPIELVGGSQHETWPETLDDSQAREQWGFDPQYGLEEILEEMDDTKLLMVPYKKAKREAKKELKSKLAAKNL